MVTFKVSEREAHMLIAAMGAVAPSGGGSGEYTLCRKLMSQYIAQNTSGLISGEMIERMTLRYCAQIITDAREAGVL
jgi:hypothetical protein